MKDVELKYCKILGTNINVTDMNKTVAYLEEHLEELRGKYVCVSNVHTTVTAFKDREYRNVQKKKDIGIFFTEVQEIRLKS